MKEYKSIGMKEYESIVDIIEDALMLIDLRIDIVNSYINYMLLSCTYSHNVQRKLLEELEFLNHLYKVIKLSENLRV